MVFDLVYILHAPGNNADINDTEYYIENVAVVLCELDAEAHCIIIQNRTTTPFLMMRCLDLFDYFWDKSVRQVHF